MHAEPAFASANSNLKPGYFVTEVAITGIAEVPFIPPWWLAMKVKGSLPIVLQMIGLARAFISSLLVLRPAILIFAGEEKIVTSNSCKPSPAFPYF